MGNKNNKAIYIGMSLIVIVAIFTFVRPLLQKKEVIPENSAVKDEKYSFISIFDLVELLKNKDGMAIFDLRSADEFRQEHISNSINANADNIDSLLVNVENGAKIILIGTDSNDLNTKIFADSLIQKDRKDFSILSGGIAAWINAQERTVRLGNPGSLADQAKINIVKPEELKILLDSKDFRFFILDLRPEKAYAAEHLPQAQNIPADQLEKNINLIPIGKNIVYYAASELEAFQYGVTLFDLGFPRSSALEGGIEGWKAKGFFTEK